MSRPSHSSRFYYPNIVGWDPPPPSTQEARLAHYSQTNLLHQRFPNFFQVGTTFISQNVQRTTLLLSPLKANISPWPLHQILNYSVWYTIHVNFIFSVFFGLMFNLRGPQGQNPRTNCGPQTTVWETLSYTTTTRNFELSTTKAHNEHGSITFEIRAWLNRILYLRKLVWLIHSHKKLPTHTYVINVTPMCFEGPKHVGETVLIKECLISMH
jgi:hypothetical protein